MADSVSSLPPRRTRPVVVLAIAVAFLAAIWSALWLFLSNRAGGAFEQWLAAERRAGRQWTCPDRHVGGYPFAVTLRCTRPTFKGEVAGRTADGLVETLEAGVGLDHPRRLAVTLGSPMILRSEAEDFNLAVSWAGMTGTIDDLGGHDPHGSLSAERIAVTLMTAGQGDLNLRAATLAASGAPADTGPGDARFDLAATRLAFPTLDALTGLDTPADLDARGVLHRLDLLRAPTRAALEAWRGAGGALDLAALAVTKGAFHGEASGVLGLDDAHRPAGKLDAALSGFEPIAQRYGIPLAGVRLGGLLSSLLGGGKAPAGEGGNVVRLPLTLADGALSVGPFRTGVKLEPWY